MLLHAGKAKPMCTTFNCVKFRDISVLQADTAGLSFLLASTGSNSFGNLSINGISC
uniref:Uncharacterized protein n=1 Tax=Arundo donax TaxID=35708 RepID=A0A0A8YMB1_ARUDO